MVKTALKPGTTRRILTYARPYRLLITVFLVLVSISAVLVVVPPLLFRRVIDDAIPAGDIGAVWVDIGIAALVIVLNIGVIGLVQRWYSARIGEGLIFDLRSQVFAHVSRQPIAFFTRTQTGALISRLNSDVIGAQQAFTSTLSGVFSNVITLVVVGATMFALSWQITLASIALIPLFLIPARRVGRNLQGLTRQAMNLNADMSSVMTERFNVSGALLMKIFGRPSDEDAHFGSKAASVRDIGVKIAMANRVFFTALTMVAALATALVYGIGGTLVIQNALTLGTMVALAGLLGQLLGPITSLANVRVDVMTALVSFERVFEVLDLPSIIDEKPDAVSLPDGPSSITFSHVAFSYPTANEVSLASLESVATLDRTDSAEVLHDVTFTVEPGEMVALVGPSGAGKTTMTSLVSRMYDPSSGTVSIAGHDVRDVTLQSLRDTVGVVTQEAHMFHDTIAANLLYAKPDATREQMLTALEAAQVRTLVESLPDGLDTVVGDRGYRLSGGEKQRMALARLLLKAPRIVVLDEATAHLDSESEAAVQVALEQALRGRTSLVIAHRLSTVRDADKIVVVDDGRIIESGTHEELLAGGGLYRDLYRTQFEGQSRDVPA